MENTSQRKYDAYRDPFNKWNYNKENYILPDEKGLVKKIIFDSKK